MNNLFNLELINHFNSYLEFQNVNIEYDSKMRILYFNAISIRNKFIDVIQFINSFPYIIHIVVISETRLYEEENCFYDIQNYTAYHSNRKKCNEYGRGSGTVIYIHFSLFSKFVFEECIENKYHFLIIKLIEQNIHVISVYRSPKKATESNFIQRFSEILSIYKHSILIGDINLDILNRKDNQIEFYKENILINGFCILNKICPEFATRVTDSSSTILEHVITDEINTNYDLLVEDLFFSDHRYLLLSTNINSRQLIPHKNNYSKSITCYDKIEKHNIWNELHNFNTFDELIQKILLTLNEYKITIVYKTLTGKQPWVSKDLIILIKERNKFYRFKKKIQK